VASRAVPDVAQGARTFPLIVELAPDERLAPGMTLTAQLPTGGLREALTVHRDAVLRNEVGAYVYVATPGGDDAGGAYQASFAPVELLFYSGQRAAVRSPALQPGALVVIEGNERLYPSAPVIPQEGPSKQAGPTPEPARESPPGSGQARSGPGSQPAGEEQPRAPRDGAAPEGAPAVDQGEGGGQGGGAR
jgi:hypothetical protein